MEGRIKSNKILVHPTFVLFNGFKTLYCGIPRSLSSLRQGRGRSRGWLIRHGETRFLRPWFFFAIFEKDKILFFLENVNALIAVFSQCVKGEIHVLLIVGKLTRW
jgi:hypothetical protein